MTKSLLPWTWGSTLKSRAGGETPVQKRRSDDLGGEEGLIFPFSCGDDFCTDGKGFLARRRA